MAQRNIDISVLVLCYQSEAYIEECIRSVLAQQTSCSVEIVVVDDQSKDDSYDKIKALATSDTEFPIAAYQNENNLGSLGNLRRGLRYCSGMFIAYLEGDDYWTDVNKLEEQYQFLLSNNNFQGIGGGCQFVNELGEDIEQRYYTLQEDFVFSNKQLWGFPPFQTSTFMFRNVHLKIPHDLPNDSIYNDKVLYLLTSFKGSIRYTAKTVSAYRYHGENVSSRLKLREIYGAHMHANTVIFQEVGIGYLFKYLRSMVQYSIQFIKSRF
jgi:glycosyltransferase involved in cell wall biosynthesis